jgi:hypothetical protein
MRPGRVTHWPVDRAEVTLHQILVHVIAETHRHAGHADIVRELADAVVGMRQDNDNMTTDDAAWWANHRSRVERAARDAGGRRAGEGRGAARSGSPDRPCSPGACPSTVPQCDDGRPR